MSMSHLYRLCKSKRKQLPEGWDLVEPTMLEFEERMREAVNESHEAKRVNEATWNITRIHYERNRYIFDVYHKRRLISKELYDCLVKSKLADQNLIAKWKKPGYEFLCSLQAISTNDTTYGTVGNCRVPLKMRNPQQWGPNVKTGCVSCASCDRGAPIWWFQTGWRDHFIEEREKHLSKGKRGARDDAGDEAAAVQDRIKKLKEGA